MSILLSRFVEWPWAIILAIVFPLLGALALGAERRSRARRLARLGTRQMLFALAPIGARLGAWRTVRLVAVLALGGFAFAGPRWGIGRTSTRSTGTDVVLALDASLSMMATDATPSRLDAMKDVVRQLQSSTAGDRIALLAFAGHSYVLSPLTTDASAIGLYLDNLDPQTVGVAGTSLAGAIKQATTLLTERGTDRTRVIVVMSDGEGFEPEQELADEARRAHDAKLMLVTVGFGTPKGTTIPVRDSSGKITQKIGPDGQVVITRYSPTLLSLAAREAQQYGVFIPAEATDKAERIKRILDKLQRATSQNTVAASDLASQFQWFAIPAALLLVLDSLLMLRPKRKKRMRVAVTAATASAATVLAACTGPTPPNAPNAKAAHDTTFESIYNRATRLLPRGSLVPAAWTLDSVAHGRDTTVRPRATFNSGWAYLVVGLHMKRDTSARDVPVVTRGEGPQNMLDSAFVDSALARYRAAIRRDPNDNDARWNYELALRNSKSGGKSGGKKNQQSTNKPNQEPKAGPKTKEVKPSTPNIEKIHVDPQQAEALLDASAQHERKAAKAIPTKSGHPPQGKDW